MYSQDTQEPGQTSCGNSFHRNGYDNYGWQIHHCRPGQASEVQEKIEGTDVLITDEICMVSASIFDQLDYECRNLKNSQEYFGGLILSGSFMQLPTVPSPRSNDFEEFCFKMPVFQSVFTHHIHLQEVICQDEISLITANKEL